MATTTLDDRRLPASSSRSSTRRCASGRRGRRRRRSSSALLIALSCFHYYTAGFGLLRETTHRGVHLAFVLGLIFIVFARKRATTIASLRAAGWRRAACRWSTGCSALAVALSVLYIPYIFDDLAFRVGNPTALDVVMGSILIVRCSRPRAAAWAGRCR